MCWRAVDLDGYVLDEIVQARRDTNPARRGQCGVRNKSKPSSENGVWKALSWACVIPHLFSGLRPRACGIRGGRLKMRKAGEVEPVTQEVRQDLVILGNALLRAPSAAFRLSKAEEPFRGSRSRRKSLDSYVVPGAHCAGSMKALYVGMFLHGGAHGHY